MGKADLHIHTVYSWDGTCAVKAVLKQAAHIAHLDVLAITDHDEIRGALEAVELAPQYGIEVIPGSEVSTADGHLLALFVREKIPAGLSLQETVLRVGEQGGLCVVPHPEARGAPSVKRQVLQEALRNSNVRQVLRGIETFNAGLVYQETNARAELMAQQLPLAKTGSSDAHLIWQIGQGATLFQGNTASDLREAILHCQTTPWISRETKAIGLVLSWLRGYLLRRAGWVEYNRFPEAPVRLERIPAMARFALAKE